MKFRAPFLRRHVAVDVGRHVFAALNSAELAFATVLWGGRWLAKGAAAATATGAGGVACSAEGGFCFLVYLAEKLVRATFVLPALTTVALLSQVLWIEPLLSFRAKVMLVRGFRDDAAAAESLDQKEGKELRRLEMEVGGGNLPSAKWHLIYVILEMIKVGCLTAFAILSLK